MTQAPPKAEEQKDVGRKTHDIVPEQIKEGDIMAFIYYAQVTEIRNSGSKLSVKGLTKGAPETFGVDGRSLVIGGLSADQHHETISVSTTEAARMLVTSFNMPLTVCFLKKDGTERVLRGRLIGEEPLLGYSWVEDLEQPEGRRIREVNHRELRWLIVGGIRYLVKKK